jgi:hypothetical protein
MTARAPNTLKSFTRDELSAFVEENVLSLTEGEALDVLASAYATAQVIAKIAQNSRLTGFYSVRLKLVAHRQTPQAQAVKFVHYLYWFDLLRLSIDVKVPAPVRRAIDTLLLNRVAQLSLGERIASARQCGQALIKVLLTDPDPRVFESLLINSRLREDELVALASSTRATPEQLRMLAADRKWSFRYAIRKAVVLNPNTPRFAAASQLRYLSRRDLQHIHANPSTSVYLRRCIERLTTHEDRRSARIE